MATVEFTDKENLMQRAAAINRRVESITRNNTMAGLLNNNFKKWLSNSAMSPIKLTQELDTNSDGVISGDEFANLLGKMTGERPPEWVVELVFSFVNANVNDGIPVRDWMAFLAASGMEFPDELFEEKVEVTGSIGILEDSFLTGERISTTVSFNVEVVAYEFSVFDHASKQEVHSYLTPNVDMDRPDFDEFYIEIDEAGTYTAELRHLGARLDTHVFTVTAPVVEPVVEETHEPENEPPPETAESDQPPYVPDEHGLEHFIAKLETLKLRSEAEALIASEGNSKFIARGVIVESTRTLLGHGRFRDGFTFLCETVGGARVSIMCSSEDNETPPKLGDHISQYVVPYGWNVARRELTCTSG